MSTLPAVGMRVQIFGAGCDGCRHFSGIFRVLVVEDGKSPALLVDAEEIQCEGDVREHRFGPMKVEWNRWMQCWEAECNGLPFVVNLAGHFRGPHVGRVRAATR